MSNRGKHLLEAFKVAGPNAAPPAASGGGAAPAPPSRRTPGSSTLVLNNAQLRLIGLVVLLLMVVSFLLGRVSVRGVARAAGDASVAPAASDARATQSAAPPPAVAAPQQPSAAPTAAPPSVSPPAPKLDATPRTSAEQALLDPANIYTIKLVHYSNTEANKRLAAETARYVQQTHNLPAVVAADGSGLFILVGAAPRQVDLDDYLSRVKRMSGPPPLSRPAEFHSAYVDKIDKLFRRQK